MQSPKKILIGGAHPWDSPFLKAGNHHYAELFAKAGHQVFWISHHVSLPHLFQTHNRMRVRSALRGVKKTHGVLSYAPFTLLPYVRIFPLNTAFVGKHHLRFAIPPIRKVLKSHGFDEVDVLLINDMSLLYLTEIVRYKTLVLRIVDDLAGLSPWTRSILDLQQILIQKADYVFVTSKELMKYNISGKKNFWYLPNGVDLEHFRKDPSLPQEYERIPSPRVIYVGSLFQRIDRVDMDLIAAAARALPSYNFIFIGPTNISVDEIKNKKNIFLLGPRAYDDIPAYMKHADIGIIPFKQNKLTKAMSSMKLFQYLAAGLPVVSSKMHELETMNPPVHFTASKEEFIAALQKAYREGKNRPESFEFAKKNSWAERYATLTKTIGI